MFTVKINFSFFSFFFHGVTSKAQRNTTTQLRKQLYQGTSNVNQTFPTAAA